ncbi:HAMP domain-containing sensor histidine kinase [Novosphingobium sp.]|uniref:sensor histidine kinase n=1 Tax=Novosphingobium sp. TaxID=1874826 RepID=UPI0025DC1F8A|nr:HAMP domain-containing sensor histidine kinase [Novosphingobium sp.]MCC6925374.1 HAMP domain-containing histidine kinase [Novosphingobium sp.]
MAMRSVARSLSFGLLVVGLVGLLVLLGAILLDYHITFSALNDPQALQKAVYEVGAHVLLPALVIITPMALAGRYIVHRALRPIEEAAQAVAQAPSAALGVRIDDCNFPAEIAPLADGVNGLLARMEEISQANAAFAGDVAHELRTPLTLLGLELERLEHPQAGTLLRQVRDMQKLVDQLMTITRIDARKLYGQCGSEVDLALVGSNVVAQMAPTALAGGRVLGFEDNGPTSILAEAESLAAATRNLVENALRVTPPGGSVTVVAGPGPVLSVVDCGPGLGQDELERLSHRHVRADHASSDGAGLGLAIVRRIVEAHGGRLRSEASSHSIAMEFPAPLA